MPIRNSPCELQEVRCGVADANDNACKAYTGGLNLTDSFDASLDVLWALEQTNTAWMAVGPSETSAGPHMYEWRPMRGDCVILLETAPRSLLATGGRWLKTSYHAACLAQRSNLVLACPPDRAMDLPPPLQRLIGYAMPGPVCHPPCTPCGLSLLLTVA